MMTYIGSEVIVLNQDVSSLIGRGFQNSLYRSGQEVVSKSVQK